MYSICTALHFLQFKSMTNAQQKNIIFMHKKKDRSTCS